MNIDSALKGMETARAPRRDIKSFATTEQYLSAVERRRQKVQLSLPTDRRVEFGQFFTPSRAADLIAGMVQLPNAGSYRVLDPGAGIGSLSAALIARIARERPMLDISITAIEIDPTLISHLQDTIAEGQHLVSRHGGSLKTDVVSGHLVELTAGWSRPYFERFDLVLMNPPYRKLTAASWERQSLAALGIDTPNLYSAFLAIGSLALVPDGQMVAITPRSFANGPYFGTFRTFLLSRMALDHIHVFESRSSVFADSKVLQENVIISARRSASRPDVALSISRSHADTPDLRSVPYQEVVQPNDRDQIIRIPSGASDTEVARVFADLPSSLSDTRLEVSTGRVVDFRAREYLLADHADGSVPLIYPGNLKDGRVDWPRPIRKPQALAVNDATTRLLLPNERFVLVKRFSSKEERRRIVAAIYDPHQLRLNAVAFENHLNVFHTNGHGLERHVATGLCLWLNSSVVDRFFRTFSGHTQVNAMDLRSMRYPSLNQLQRLGSAALQTWPTQQGIDDLVRHHVLEWTPSSDE